MAEDLSPQERAALRAERFYFGQLARMAALEGQRIPHSALRQMLRVTPETSALTDDGQQVTLAVSVRMSEVRVRLNAVTGELMSWYIPALAQDAGRQLPADTLMSTARALVNPPEDAVLSRSGYTSLGAREVFIARWEHHHDGAVVEGDHLEVLLNGTTGRAFSWSRRWRIPDPNGPWQTR